MFLALRDLRVARGRFALVGVVIGLVALLTTALSGLANGLVNDGISGLRGLPLTHLALQPGAQSSFSRSTLTDANLEPWQEAAANQPGLDVSPVGVSFFNAKRANGETLDIALFGVAPGSFLAPREDAQAALSGDAGLVLSDEFRSTGVKVGDELTIVGVDTKVPILGFTYAGSYGHVDIAFSSLQTWQSLVFGDNPKGRFSAIAVRSEDDTDAALAAIGKRAGTDVETKVAAYAGSPGYSAESATMTLIRGFLLVISALIVGAFFTVWTIQRSRQIGLLKALGASNAYVLRDALGQLAIVLVSAVVVGAAIALGLGALVPAAVPFSLEASPIITSVVTLVVLGMAGSLVAVRRITSVDPIVALSTEN